MNYKSIDSKVHTKEHTLRNNQTSIADVMIAAFWFNSGAVFFIQYFTQNMTEGIYTVHVLFKNHNIVEKVR